MYCFILAFVFCYIYLLILKHFESQYFKKYYTMDSLLYYGRCKKLLEQELNIINDDLK